MSDSIWHLDAAQAGLANSCLEARLDPAVPADGLTHTCVGGAVWPSASVLGFEWGPGEPIARDTLQECVIRGQDLMASYGETPEKPIRVEATWRYVPVAPGCGMLAAVELILTVCTSVLDSRPALFARSRMAAGEVFRLVDVSEGRFSPVDLPQASAATASQESPACLVFRPEGKNTSYVEMVHPADFFGDEMGCPTGAEASVDVRHALFARPLEKGVILRSRVRGMWVARDGDLAASVEGYRSFAVSEPPLGS